MLLIIFLGQHNFECRSVPPASTHFTGISRNLLPPTPAPTLPFPGTESTWHAILLCGFHVVTLAIRSIELVCILNVDWLLKGRRVLSKKCYPIGWILHGVPSSKGVPS